MNFNNVNFDDTTDNYFETKKSKNYIYLILAVILSVAISVGITIIYTSKVHTRVEELETNIGNIRMKKLWEDYNGTTDTAGSKITLRDNISNYDFLLVYYIDGYGILEKRVVDGVNYYNNATSQAGTNQTNENLNLWNQYILLKEISDTVLEVETAGMYFESDVSNSIGITTGTGNAGNIAIDTAPTNYATRPIWAIYGLKFN